MPNALLIADRLTEAEMEMERVVEEDGLYLVIRNRTTEKIERKTPPSADEIREHIGRYMIENCPLNAMPGVVYWCYEEHRIWAPELEVLYEQHGELFIQDWVGGVVVITRLDKFGRTRLLSKDDVPLVEKWLRAK